MTTTKPMDDGGPAFPVAEWDFQTFQPKTVEEIRRLLSGMTLRDYFAAKAMQAEIVSSGEITNMAACAHWSYTMADAMIRARTKEQA